MLQLPINVYPDKVAFDSTSAAYDRDVHFNFKGDILSAVYWRVYDYDTQRVVLDDVIYKPELYPLAYNNDYVEFVNMFNTLPTRKSYILQMMFCQTYKYDDAFYGNYDMFTARGEIVDDVAANSQTIKIEDKINIIYPWNRNGSVCSANIEEITHDGITEEVDLAAIQIRIDGGEKNIIESYDRDTGIATLRFAWTNSYPAGTSYQLYASYLITSQYFFQTVKTPQIENVTVTPMAYGMIYSAFYWQKDRQMLKYYTLDVYKNRGNSNNKVWHLVKKTPKIYSQNINYTFVDDYDYECRSTSSGIGGNDYTREYRFIFTGVMQTGMTISNTYDYVMPERKGQIATSATARALHASMNTVRVEVETASGAYWLDKCYRAYRLNADGLYNPYTSPTKLAIDYTNIPDKTLVYDGAWNGGFEDYTASAKGEYRYMIVPYMSGENTEVYEAVISNVVKTDYYGYTITAIYDSNMDADNMAFYKFGDTWKFLADIEDTTVTQNTSKELHIGYGKYSTLTSTDVNYASGSLSGMIANLVCPNKVYDDIELVRAWRRFITQDCQFILKSQKGDVWVVNIVENPTTQYREDVAKLPTRFTFSWAECGDIKDILCGEFLPPKVVDRW